MCKYIGETKKGRGPLDDGVTSSAMGGPWGGWACRPDLLCPHPSPMHTQGFLHFTASLMNLPYFYLYILGSVMFEGTTEESIRPRFYKKKGRNVLTCSRPLWTCNSKKHPLICINVCTLAAGVFFFFFLDSIKS